jgi:hypothetical protein
MLQRRQTLKHLVSCARERTLPRQMAEGEVELALEGGELLSVAHVNAQVALFGIAQRSRKRLVGLSVDAVVHEKLDDKWVTSSAYAGEVGAARIRCVFDQEFDQLEVCVPNRPGEHVITLLLVGALRRRSSTILWKPVSTAIRGGPSGLALKHGIHAWSNHARRVLRDGGGQRKTGMVVSSSTSRVAKRAVI